MIQPMTREELIEMAKQTRKTNPRPLISREELDRYPAVVTRRVLETSAGQTTVYLSTLPEGAQGGPLMIHLHGGGFLKPWSDMDGLFCRILLQQVGGCTVDIDYHTAPEHPFPVAVHEVYEITAWALDHAAELGADPEKLILIGHSSGGNLAVGICMRALETGDFQPKLAILDYPPLDLYTSPANKKQRGGVPPERAELYNLYYCDREKQKDPYASPLYAAPEQLKGFPSTVILTGENDSLCDEAEAFGLMLASVGTEVTLKRFPGAGHAFVIRRQSGWQEALGLMVRRIREAIQL